MKEAAPYQGDIIRPSWKVPTHIKAFTTTRLGGVSPAPYASLNLGDHVGDDINHVLHNRALVYSKHKMPNPPLWLTQTHSSRVIEAKDWFVGCEADAIYTNQPEQVCTVMTADCLPILISDQTGCEIAAIHAGWRGLANHIIEHTVAKFSSPAEQLRVWLAPAIGPREFEVGHDVYEAFISHHQLAQAAFIRKDADHFDADIYQLARLRFKNLGINQIDGGDYCTVQQPELFFSYRRDGQQTGRMASFIWIDKNKV